MYAVSTLGILALALTGFGIGFKKNYFLFAAFVFWVGLGIYLAYNFTWFGAGQWSFILIGFLIGIPLIFTAFKMQIKEATTIPAVGEAADLDADGEYDYDKSYSNYSKESSIHKTRRKKKSGYLKHLR